MSRSDLFVTFEDFEGGNVIGK